MNVVSIDLTCPLNEEMDQSSGQVPLSGTGCCNGVALWVDWVLDDEISVSGGPVAPVVVGENINWDINSKQGVFFFQIPVDIGDNRKKFHYQVYLNHRTYELKFSFSVQ